MHSSSYFVPTPKERIQDIKSANIQEIDDLVICVFIGKSHANDISFPEIYGLWPDSNLRILQDIQTLSGPVHCPYSGVDMPKQKLEIEIIRIHPVLKQGVHIEKSIFS